MREDGKQIVTKLDEIEFWGDALARWPEDVAAVTGLSEEDRTYLAEVGLPRSADWTITADPPEPGGVPPMIGECLMLAHDDDVPLCAEKLGGGSVVAIESVEPSVRRFVNSNVRLFGRCLMLYQRHRLRGRELDDEDQGALVDETEEAMRAADSRALADEETYWSLVIEQLRSGLL